MGAAMMEHLCSVDDDWEIGKNATLHVLDWLKCQGKPLPHRPDLRVLGGIINSDRPDPAGLAAWIRKSYE